ncbi:hypothetical protein [Streptomyces sp. NPDC001594]|uniref:hypothetical protein n=1 Tax=Streptomyces sp. NPDC001594 TaxID=3364590 RepID=UPI0036B2ABD3
MIKNIAAAAALALGAGLLTCIPAQAAQNSVPFPPPAGYPLVLTLAPAPLLWPAVPLVQPAYVVYGVN